MAHSSACRLGAGVQPGLRVVLLLCDPVARLHALRPPPTPAALSRERLAFEACARRAPAASCARDGGGGAAVLDGAYSLWVRELLRAVPEEQLRVVTAEDLRQRPDDALRALHRFMGVEAHGEPLPPLVGPTSTAKSPLPAATQASLHQFYEAFNEELAHFMDGDPRFLWHRAGQA